MSDKAYYLILAAIFLTGLSNPTKVLDRFIMFVLFAICFGTAISKIGMP